MGKSSSSESSLISLTGLTSCSSSSGCNSSSSSSCSSCSSSSSTCSSSPNTSSCYYTNSSSSCSSSSSSSSSCFTYTSDSCSSSSSCTDTSCSSYECKCKCDPKLVCVKPCKDTCKKLACNWKKCKHVLCANKEIMVMLNFIKNKLLAVQPNVDVREVDHYSVQANIHWLEHFIDTLFCVLRKNNSLNCIKFKDCKVKNDDECQVSDRLYVIKVKFSNGHKKCTRTYVLNFNWTRLTGNNANSYNGILDTVVSQINTYVTELQAQNTSPFLGC
jgi:hypothetical protein